MDLDGTLWSLFVSPTAAASRGPKEFLWWSQAKIWGTSLLVGKGQELHFDQYEVLSFLGFVPKVTFLPSKRCLAVVLATWHRVMVRLLPHMPGQEACWGGVHGWVIFSLWEDDHLEVAGQALLPRQRGWALLPLPRSGSRSSWRQPRTTSGGGMGGLRVTVVANPPGNQPSRDHCSSQLSCQWNVLGPLQGTYQQYPWCSSRRPDVDRYIGGWAGAFWRFGCAAALPVAMPESDPEMTSMLSRATERVGPEWRPPPYHHILFRL